MKMWCLLFFVLSFLISAITARYIWVDKGLKNQPIIIGDLSQSGFVPLGNYGHGEAVWIDGDPGWYIGDIPAKNGMVRKICAYGQTPPKEMDIDFIYHKEQWHKLRSGHVTISKQFLQARPETQMWKGMVKTKMVFPVRKPDWPYRFKNVWSKIRYGSMTPLDYVRSLKSSNPSCHNIPAP